MKRIFVCVGTRPEAIKMAPVYGALKANSSLDPILISTGQHKEMLAQVFDWFNLEPDEDLEVMEPNQTLSQTLSKSLVGLDRLIDTYKPDAVLAQGDTTTVLATALAAFNASVDFGHVEAGLRTYDLDRPFPEEGFRQMASRVAKWHFAPTRRAANVLESEKVSGEVFLTGNTVIDALMDTVARNPDIGLNLTRKSLCLITGHRRENHGARFDVAFKSMARLAELHPDVDFVYPVHLNPNVKTAAHGALANIPNFHLTAPVPYPQMIALMKRARIILTDSGGIQEEAPSLGVPVLVMRDSTEREEAVNCGAARLVGTSGMDIISNASDLLRNDDLHARMSNVQNPFGDGLSAARIAAILSGQPVSQFSTPNHTVSVQNGAASGTTNGASIQ